ncbi:asparagine--tRNA ligase [Oribacterium sp. P9]|uniref:asparagine--tRNA ligase n=1 Tax=unclassified Oribacterium TaxID=2629782 RepID=UPI002A7B3D69|nr:asparagine--tRNA ligase [Oribacterium sp.]MDD6518718.1 asparagine--tRNA ligase [Oribacterium sp.]MDY2855107.1 asparagine--tRNA ligase [Oliverpabstia sp.]
MKVTTLREIFKNKEAYYDQEVTVGGWVRSNRDSKQFGFLTISDGTFFTPLQVVYHDTMANFQEVAKYGVGAAVIVKGKLVATPDAKQAFEVQADEVMLEGASSPDYPLQKKRHTLEYLRTIDHLRPRTNTFQAVFKIRSLVAFAIHQFFQERGFVYVHTPIITASDAEGAGEMFQVTTLPLDQVPMTEDGKVDFSQDFFNKKTSLTVSGQLYGETFAQAFRNIYTFGPTFRAENSNTQRHAAEFWMIEPELAYADLDDVIQCEEDMLKYMIQYVLDNAPEEMAFLNQFVDKGLLDRLHHVLNSEFARVTYTDAVNELMKHNDEFEYKVSWGVDLQTEHERYLTEQLYKRPVFVTDYPKDIKAFYMKQNPDGKTVAAVDCLVPGIGEIMGGSQREEDYDKLLKRMNEMGMEMDQYDFYLDLRKYGTTRHGGFGLGFERAVMYITGMSNIRDVVPYPRTVGNCDI